MAKRSGGGRAPQRDSGQLRIIGGEWRGRKLAFTASEGLRPTTDRVRETLFNWLSPWLPGAHCVDLFAGSGALGLEALSRGAASCQFVDLDRVSCRQIDDHLERLQAAQRGATHNQGADAFLASWGGTPFDIAFVDPPFGRDLAGPALAALAQHSLLAAGALVYLECGDKEPFPTLPPTWNIIRDKRAGAVRYCLLDSGSAG